MTGPSREGTSSFSDWKDYATSKRKKLGVQWGANHGAFETQQPECPTTTLNATIFCGISIYVNGYTIPTSLELRDLVMRHGGNYEYQLRKQSVTHIIATNLTDQKISQLVRTDKIVRPEWITESIAAGYLLPWTNYQLYIPGALISGQGRLTDEKLDNAGPMICTSETQLLPKKDDPGSNTEKTSLSHTKRDTHDVSFLREYYKASRLHHLSTWKSELKEFVKNAQCNKNQKQSFLPNTRVLMHVDMDSFFVSVSLRDHPELKEKPVAVSHSKGPINATFNGASGTSDIASCNYVARKFGIKNGMSSGKALRLCPSLVLMPYDFEKYAEVSRDIYTIFLKEADIVQVGSCDEAILDMSGHVQQRMGDSNCGILLKETISKLAQEIRTAIETKTGCTASIGASHNILLARMSTKEAKPNGQCIVMPSEAASFMLSKKVSDLPGVGHILFSKLRRLNLETCKDIIGYGLSTLQQVLGPKVGAMIYQFSCGEDHRNLDAVDATRKSIGAEVNWGVRLKDSTQVNSFLWNLAEEVSKRLLHANVKARQLVLKMKKRAKNAGEPSKFMGCGSTDDMSKSIQLHTPCSDTQTIYTEALRLLSACHCPPTEIRGVGIHMQLLNTIRETSHQTTLPTYAESGKSINRDVTFEEEDIGKLLGHETVEPQCDIDLRVSQIDMETLKLMPYDIQKEIHRFIDSRHAVMEIPKISKKHISPNKKVKESKFTLTQQWPRVDEHPDLTTTLDWSMLQELPKDVIDDVMRDYTILKMQRKECSKLAYRKKELSCGAGSDQMASSSPCFLKREKPNLMGCTDIDQLRDVLSTWVQSTEAPLQLDLATIKRYMMALVDDAQLDMVAKLLSFIRRKTSGNTAWAVHCQWIQHDVLNYVYERYHAQIIIQ